MILVVGATGMLGGRVVSLLAERGEHGPVPRASRDLPRRRGATTSR